MASKLGAPTSAMPATSPTSLSVTPREKKAGKQVDSVVTQNEFTKIVLTNLPKAMELVRKDIQEAEAELVKARKEGRTCAAPSALEQAKLLAAAGQDLCEGAKRVAAAFGEVGAGVSAVLSLFKP